MGDNISQDDLKKIFREALTESGRDLNYDGKDLDKLMDNLKKLDKDVEKNRSTMGGLAREMLTGRKVFKDFSDDINQLDSQLEKLADTSDENEIALRGELLKRRESVQLMAQHNAAQKAVIQGLTAFSKTTTGAVGKTMGGFVRGLQDGSSAFALAGGVMEGAMDVANAGAQALGTGMTTIGSTMATSTNPRVRMLGIAAAAAGIAINGLSTAVTGVGKFIVSYMIKQLEMTVEAFQKTSSAGAMFAGGMTEMTYAATEAGLTVKQFSDVMQKHAGDLGMAGMGVTEGSKRIGGALTAGGKEMRTSLLKMGYTFEEHAGLVAETMRDMSQTGGPLRASNIQVAKETEKYAENLRVISAISGEDAKKKMEETRRKAGQLAFQQKLDQLEPTQRAAVLRGFSNMSDLQQDNFMDMVNFGSVINERGAIAESANAAFADQDRAFYKAYQDRTLSEESVRDIQKQHNDAIRKELTQGESSIALGTAQAAGVIGDLGTALGNELVFQQNHTKEGIVAGEEAAKAQKKANDDLTNNVVIAAKAAQQLAMDLQTLVLPQLANFVALSTHILTAITSMLDELGIGAGASGGFFENIGNKYGANIGAGLGGGAAVAAAPFTGGGSMLGLATGMGMGYNAGSEYGGTAGKWLDKTFGTGSKASRPGTTGGVVPQIPTGLIPGGKQGTGLIDPALQDKLALVMQAFPGSRITSLNDSDNFNRDPTDVHARGRAMDFVPADFDPNRVDEYIKTLRGMGLNAQFERKGQVNANGSKATGDHIHAQLMANGGNLGPGQTAIVGERGPEIIHGPGSVTSTAATSKIFGEMLDRLEEMVDVLKDNRDYSEKILHATQ
jgi:hypothetical protein